MAVATIPLRNPARVARHPGLVPARIVARRGWKAAVLWGALVGGSVWELVREAVTSYPTAADRARLVASMGNNVGWNALFGPAHHIDTVRGYVPAHLMGFFGLGPAMWGLLVGTRLLRGEEEAGRWEILLAGPTTRRRTAAAAMGGLGVVLVVLWAVTATVIALVGRGADARFSVTASLFLATAVVAPTAMFLAVGALSSQLAVTRRQAVMVGAAIFGVVYLIRAVAYTSTDLRFLRWASPFNWVDEMRPLTGSRPLLVVPIVAFLALVVGATIVLAGRRDLGASILPARDTATARTRLLTSPLGLACRLDLRSAIGWTAGLAGGGLVFGLLTKTSEEVWKNTSGGFIQQLGGASGGAAYLGMVFLIVGLVVALAAAAQAANTREEESEGYLDHLLARPVDRVRWLAGRFAVSAALLAVVGVATGAATWVGAVASGADLRLGSLLAAGANVVSGGIFVLGIGTLAHAVVPRLTSLLAYGVVGWSFLAEIFAANFSVSRWLLDLSVFHHLARAPAAPVRWDSAGALVALGLAAAVVGAMQYTRRDLAGA